MLLEFHDQHEKAARRVASSIILNMTPIIKIKEEITQLTFLKTGVKHLFEDLKNTWKNG